MRKKYRKNVDKNLKLTTLGFTLVELLAVIVILAIILVIAIPQIIKTIEAARLGAFKSTAKLVLTQAEKQYLVDETLKVDEGSVVTTTYEGIGEAGENSAPVGCGVLAKLGSDYSACKVTVDSDGVATLVTLTGANKFANYSCENATLSNVDNVCNNSGNNSGSGSEQTSTLTGAETLIAKCTGDCLTGTPNSDGLFKDENGDYRYTGLNVNNYATFNGETWRIIGIFNGRIKLMRDAAIGNTKWDSTSPYSNAWEDSEIELGLNGDYLTSTGYLGSSLSSNAQLLIENADWYTTPLTQNQNTSSAYNAEHTGNTISRKVGLIYISDYGYASSTCRSDKSLNSYNAPECTGSNWMYTNMDSINWWIMAPKLESSGNVLNVRAAGHVSDFYLNNSFDVRPSVYLKSNVKISGNGNTTYYTFS